MYRPIRTGAAALGAVMMLLLAGCASNLMVQNLDGDIQRALVY